ncbi:MAG: Bug family tripartite tricarboxylate transporter substrate binding protein [Burkholderiales bacterium]
MRRGLRFLVAAGLLAGLWHAGACLAQAYPDRPVKVVIPWPPGGIADTTARLIAAHLQEATGKPFVADNRPGAATMIGTTAVAKAPPDGYTLLLANTNISTNPSLFKTLQYDADKELTPVSLAMIIPAVLAVNASVPATNMVEFLALAKAKPGVLNFGSVGLGSFNHLAGEMLNQLAGIQLTHVPYKGFAPATAALLGNEINILVSDLPNVAQHIKAGKLRALAVTGRKRMAVLPDVPTLAEAGVRDYVAEGWLGIMVPAGTPRAIVTQLNAEINRGLQSPAMTDRYTSQGVELTPWTTEAFAAYILSSRSRWAQVITRGNIRLSE